MKIVGVSVCSTGIAHTYMAAEGLVEAARARNHEIKMETQGALGLENEIEMEDVENADVVLLATSCLAEGLERFEGKPIVDVDISEAVKDPTGVIIQCEKIVNQ